MSVMLYKHPGHHALHGGFYDYVVVNEADVEKHLADGWALTTDEAKSGPEPAPAPKRSRRKKTED